MKSVLSAAIAVAFISVVPPLAHGQGAVPKLINYQGKLTDSTGAAVADGEYSVKFELFDAASAGTLVWGETRPVTLVGGIFNVALGGAGSVVVPGVAVNDIGFAFASSERYLQTTIESGPGVAVEQTLLPRQQMTSVPFAVEASNGVPPGTVLPFFGIDAPYGLVICAGQSLAREGAYSRLFAVIGSSCGAPDGNTFNVPDLRGRFLRGVDDPDGSGSAFVASGRDPDAGVRSRMKPGGNLASVDPGIGTVQGDHFRSHAHPGSTFAAADHRHWTSFGSDGNNGYSSNDRFGSRVVNVAGQHFPNGFFGAAGPRRESSTDVPTATAAVVSEGGSETRPLNAACNFIIKY